MKSKMRNMHYMLFSYRSDLYGFMKFSEVEQYVQQIVVSMCQEQEGKEASLYCGGTAGLY